MPFLTNDPLPQCLQLSPLTPLLLAQGHQRGSRRHLSNVKCLTFSYRTRPGSRHGPGKGSPDAGSSSVGAIRPSWLTRTLAWASADPYARRSATRAVPLLSGARGPAVPHAAPPCRSPPLHGNHWTPLAKSPG